MGPAYVVSGLSKDCQTLRHLVQQSLQVSACEKSGKVTRTRIRKKQGMIFDKVSVSSLSCLFYHCRQAHIGYLKEAT